MDNINIITLITAITGAILGIINTYNQSSKDRIRLIVIPKIGYMVSGNTVITAEKPNLTYQERYKNCPERLCIEVINLSTFPVSISDVGFGKHSKARHILRMPELSEDKTWPPRLEAREAVTVYGKIGEELDPKIMKKPVAYVKTDCGTTKYGTSPIFKKYIQGIKYSKGK